MQHNSDILARNCTPTCASEPIHIPGSIQPHGLLLLFDATSGLLAHWAGDFDLLLGTNPRAGKSAFELLGKTLDEMIAPRQLLEGQEAAYLGHLQPDERSLLAIQAHRTGSFSVDFGSIGSIILFFPQ